jgi:hypothetical protein
MSRARTLISVASGRRAKWAVVVFWPIIVAVAGPLSGKLTGGGEERLVVLAPSQGQVEASCGGCQ